MPAGIEHGRDAIRIVMETGIMIALGLFVIQKGNIWIGLFVLLSVFSFFYPLAGGSALLTRNSIFFGVVWYVIVISVFNKDTVKFLMWAMCGIAFIHTLFLVWQYFGSDPYRIFTFGLMWTTVISEPTGLMPNSNEASGLLALVAPAFLINRYLRWGLLIVTIGLFISKSTGGVIAVIAGAFFYLALSGFSPRILIISIGVFLTTTFLYIKYYKVASLGDRLDLLDIGWKYYKEHWVFGYGLGHWKVLTKHLHAHNDYFQVLFEMGVGAWILITGYLISVFRKFTKEALISTTALVVILVHSSYSWLWCIGTTAIIQVTWLGILTIQLRECSITEHESI